MKDRSVLASHVPTGHLGVLVTRERPETTAVDAVVVLAPPAAAGEVHDDPAPAARTRLFRDGFLAMGAATRAPLFLCPLELSQDAASPCAPGIPSPSEPCLAGFRARVLPRAGELVYRVAIEIAHHAFQGRDADRLAIGQLSRTAQADRSATSAGGREPTTELEPSRGGSRHGLGRDIG